MVIFAAPFALMEWTDSSIVVIVASVAHVVAGMGYSKVVETMMFMLCGDKKTPRIKCNITGLFYLLPWLFC
jgi:hypothetical protein